MPKHVKKRAVKKGPAKKKPISRASRKARKVTKKPAPAGSRPAAAKSKKEQIVGIVTHYFPKVSAAAVKLKQPLQAGAVIRIKGHTTDFTQTISSMQLDHAPISSAKKGQEIGIMVKTCVRRNDKVSLAE